MIGTRRWYVEGDPLQQTVKEESICMDEEECPERPRYNWVSVESRCPEGYLQDTKGNCVEWIPLSTDAMCLGLNRDATLYDIPNPQTYKRCLDRARALCEQPNADPTYCACLRDDTRCLQGSVCNRADIDTTFLTDYTYADTSKCPTSTVKSTGDAALISVYVLLALAIVAAVLIVIKTVYFQSTQ